MARGTDGCRGADKAVGDSTADQVACSTCLSVSAVTGSAGVSRTEETVWNASSTISSTRTGITAQGKARDTGGTGIDSGTGGTVFDEAE